MTSQPRKQAVAIHINCPMSLEVKWMKQWNLLS